MTSNSALFGVSLLTMLKVLLAAFTGFMVSRLFSARSASEVGVCFIAMQVMLPCLLFSNIVVSVTWDNAAYYGWALLIACVHVTLGCIASLLLRLVLPVKYRPLLVLSCTFPNGLAFPLGVLANVKQLGWMSNAAAEKAQSYILVHNIVCGAALWAGASTVVSRYANSCQAQDVVVEPRRDEDSGEPQDAEAIPTDSPPAQATIYPFQDHSAHPASAVTTAAGIPVQQQQQQQQNNVLTHKASSSEQLAWYKPRSSRDSPTAPVDGAGCDSKPLSPVLAFLLATVKPPVVWVALLSMLIGIVAPLRWLAESYVGNMIVGGIGITGGGTVPLMLLALTWDIIGANTSKAEAEAKTESDGNSKMTWLLDVPGVQLAYVGMTTLVRLVLVPIVCFAIIFGLSSSGIIAKHNGPYLLSLLIVSVTPPAAETLLMCTSHQFCVAEYSHMMRCLYLLAMVFMVPWLFFFLRYVDGTEI